MALIETHRTTAAPRAPLSLIARLGVWRSRRALGRLDARLLDDIGISAEEARKETQRSFWDAPAYLYRN